MIRKIKQYFRNLKVFHKTLTEYQPWDSCGLLVAMRDATQALHDNISGQEDFVSVNRDKDCKRMRVFINSLDRLIEDEYTSLKDFDYRHFHVEGNSYKIICSKLRDLPSKKMKHKVEKSQREVDQEIVAEAFLKHYDKWWH